MSGVGKGVATASMGTLLSAKGFKVNLVKVDPYLNVDAGTMNPTEHGEVFVLNSGLETDQDMGNYERFLGRDLLPDDYVTSGMVYKYVIEKERSLGYGGLCVEAIPHIRDEIVHRFKESARVNKSDISIIEIGGTIGDYQNALFIEAARSLKTKHPQDVIVIMVSYLPVPSKLGEMKTRPTQNAVHQLASYGLATDIIIGRSEIALDHKRKEKIAAASNIPPERVISAPDIESIYDVPGNFEKDHLGKIILEALSLPYRRPGVALTKWKKVAAGIKNHHANEIHIGVVGKYFSTGDFTLSDSYLSVLEAIKFSAYAAGVRAVIQNINALDFEKKKPNYSLLDKLDGIVVPGGFGKTGVEGKIDVIRYARENKIPYFGLCYGMQLMVVEYARHVLGLADAHTAEVSPRNAHRVIDIMLEQKDKLIRKDFGGTMRLGLYPTLLEKGSIAHNAYGKDKIFERHRHRYEVNPDYVERLSEAGLVFSGLSPDGRLCEIAELSAKKHPFFLGTQFHPELLARPLSPHPLFSSFLKAAKKYKSKQKK